MSWERQPGESVKAFGAFRVYLELGPKRSLRLVSQKCTKSIPLLKRWSAKWHWRKRVRAYTSELAAEADRKAEKARDGRRDLAPIMSSLEVLARVSMLGRVSAVDLLNEKGEIDIADIRKRGLSYAVQSVKTTKTTYPNGAVSVRTELKIEPRRGLLQLLGDHHDLWGKQEPEEVFRRLLGIPRHRLPRMGMTDSVPGQLIEDGKEQSELKEGR
jgi:hypothetical protein